MGALYSGVCFDSASGASTAAFSSVVPVVSPSGELHVVELVGGLWMLDSYGAGGLVSSVAAPVPSFASCDLADYLVDSSVLSFAVVSVWAVAWGINVLRRVL